MKVYIASSFDLIDLVDEYAGILEANGHEITVKWWDHVYESEGGAKAPELKEKYDSYSWDQFMDRPEVAETFSRDFEGVKTAGAFLFVADPYIPKKYNGATAEYGIAVSNDIPCMLLGQLETSCLFKRLNKLESIYEVVRILNALDDIHAFLLGEKSAEDAAKSLIGAFGGKKIV